MKGLGIRVKGLGFAVYRRVWDLEGFYGGVGV